MPGRFTRSSAAPSSRSSSPSKPASAVAAPSTIGPRASGASASSTTGSGQRPGRRLGGSSASGSSAGGSSTSLVPSTEAADRIAPSPSKDNKETLLELQAREEAREEEAEQMQNELTKLLSDLKGPNTGVDVEEDDKDTPRGKPNPINIFAASCQSTARSPCPSPRKPSRPSSPRKGSSSSLASTSSASSIVSGFSLSSVVQRSQGASVAVGSAEADKLAEELNAFLSHDKGKVSHNLTYTRAELREMGACPRCTTKLSSSATRSFEHLIVCAPDISFALSDT